MKDFLKLSINPERLIRTEDLLKLKGGVAATFWCCISCDGSPEFCGPAGCPENYCGSCYMPISEQWMGVCTTMSIRCCMGGPLS